MKDVAGRKVRVAWLVFAVAGVLALAWAATTQHVWEDYYITFRSSRNLASGHGLVFNHGERLHTFTSPLGVLLPALASWLTGSRSDEAALWIFRVWSAAALGGAAVFVLALARRLQFGPWAAAATLGFVLLDAKTLDFSSNGMETGFLLCFLGYTLWAMFGARHRPSLHLGAAWAGLMWTRPDGFIYVGLLAAAVWIFNDRNRTGRGRLEWLGLFLRAGLICALLYLPWLTWATWYYGSPVPHTIVAKGGVSGPAKSAQGVLRVLLGLPWKVWTGGTSLESTFLPSYFQQGGWPISLVYLARAAALLLAFQWIWPKWRCEVRTSSFAFCGLHVYLSYFPYFPFPWYLPGPALLAAVTAGGMVAQLLSAGPEAVAPDGLRVPVVRWWRAGLAVVVAGFLLTEGWLCWQMNREMAAEQTYTATAVRRQVGEWLKSNAEPNDTVFMEPLGNIGYFSGLKTYDYPGLSSREVVEAIRVFGLDWAYLAEYLSPDWLVLRPQELNNMRNSIHRLFGDGHAYKLVQEFNSLPAIESLDVYGRKYIEFDAHLLVFRRQVPRRYRLDSTAEFPFEGLRLPVVYIDGVRMYTVHATGIVSLKVPPTARRVHVAYGLPEATYSGAR